MHRHCSVIYLASVVTFPDLINQTVGEANKRIRCLLTHIHIRTAPPR